MLDRDKRRHVTRGTLWRFRVWPLETKLHGLVDVGLKRSNQKSKSETELTTPSIAIQAKRESTLETFERHGSDRVTVGAIL